MKKSKSFYVFLVLCLCFLFSSTIAMADVQTTSTRQVTIYFKDSSNNNLGTDNLQYWGNSGGGYYRTAQINASTGSVVLDIPTSSTDSNALVNAKLTYMGKESSVQTVNVNTTTTTPASISFQTGRATVTVLDNNQNIVKDMFIRADAPWDRLLGSTDDNGQFAIELLPGTYEFGAFTNNWDNRYSAENNYAKGNITVNAGQNSKFTMCQYKMATIRFITSDGKPLSAGDVQFWRMGGGGYWQHTTIDNSGVANIDVPRLPSDTTWMSVKVTYMGKESEVKNINLATARTVTFQTGKATITVLNNAQIPVAGLSIRADAPWDKLLGTTDVSGQFSQELLPGTYKFGAFKNAWDNRYYEANDYAHGFVTVAEGVITPLTLSQYKWAKVRFIASDGKPLSSSDVQFSRAGGGGYFQSTPINASGVVNIDVPRLPTDTTSMSIKINHMGLESQVQNIDLATTTMVIFQTKKVTIDIPGTSEDTYYVRGDYPWDRLMSPNGVTGGTQFTCEVLPGTYRFGIFKNSWDNNYNGTNLIISKQIVVAN